ncbi:MAG: S1C family serine protease [Oscillospiraceae bacterium]|jgi:serine protease Do
MEYNEFNQYGRNGQEPEGASPTEWKTETQAGGASSGETAGQETLEQGAEAAQYEDLGSFSSQTAPGIEWQGKTANPAEGVKAFRWDDVDPSLGKQPPRRAKAPKPPKASKQPHQPGGYRALKVFAIVVSCVLVVVMGAFAYVLVNSHSADSGLAVQDSTGSSDSVSSYQNSSGPSLVLNETPDADSQVPVTEGPLTIPQIAAKVKPSVVGIVTYTKESGLKAAGEGSGIIMTSDGYIITNAHVIDEASAVKVVMENGSEYEAAVVGADAKTDLAVIKIEEENLTPAQFGDSDKLVTGETVVAIGNPGGLKYAGSVTQGIVSATNRVVSTSNNSVYTLRCIQTDAAINPGNSGGALVNIYGQVIGINSSKIVATGFEGIGFSITINDAKPIIDDLIANGYVTNRVKVGVTVSAIDEVLAKMYNLPEGLRILSLEQTSDAVAQGLQVGDIITKADGADMREFSDLSAILKTKKPGDTITFDVYRATSSTNGRSFQVTLTLQEDRGDSTAEQVIE